MSYPKSFRKDLKTLRERKWFPMFGKRMVFDKWAGGKGFIEVAGLRKV